MDEFDMPPTYPFSEELVAPTTRKAIDWQPLEVNSWKGLSQLQKATWSKIMQFGGGPHPRSDWCDSKCLPILDHSGSGAPPGASQGQACITTQFLPLSSPASFHSLSQVTITKPLLDTHTMYYTLHLRVSLSGNPTYRQQVTGHIQTCS